MGWGLRIGILFKILFKKKFYINLFYLEKNINFFDWKLRSKRNVKLY